MSKFYDHCLETLYPPGSCGLLCNEHTYQCFLTEVHHVTGEGEDKGVVYCEMQGRENNSSSLVEFGGTRSTPESRQEAVDRVARLQRLHNSGVQLAVNMVP